VLTIGDDKASQLFVNRQFYFKNYLGVGAKQELLDQKSSITPIIN